MEKLILQARLNGKSFFDLTEEEVNTQIHFIVLKTAAITGCRTTAEDWWMDLVKETIIEHLSYCEYKELTPFEVLLALHINVKGWPKHPDGYKIEPVVSRSINFNIDFIGRILAIYVDFRKCFEGRLKNFIDGYDNY